jgi:hypothetical protein
VKLTTHLHLVPWLKTGGAFCCVFTGTVSSPDYAGSSYNLVDKFKGTRKEEVVAKFEVLPHSLDGLRKTRKDLSEYSRCSERDSNRSSIE